MFKQRFWYRRVEIIKYIIIFVHTHNPLPTIQTHNERRGVVEGKGLVVAGSKPALFGKLIFCDFLSCTYMKIFVFKIHEYKLVYIKRLLHMYRLTFILSKMFVVLETN